MSYLTPHFIDALDYEAELKDLIAQNGNSTRNTSDVAEAALIEHWQLIAVKKERDEIKAELEFAQNENTRLEKELEAARATAIATPSDI